MNQNKFLGCLLGLAVGDALGSSLEFKKPGTFEPITRIISGGYHKLKAGQWTDDTSMALCLAQYFHIIFLIILKMVYTYI